MFLGIFGCIIFMGLGFALVMAGITKWRKHKAQVKAGTCQEGGDKTLAQVGLWLGVPVGLFLFIFFCVQFVITLIHGVNY